MKTTTKTRLFPTYASGRAPDGTFAREGWQIAWHKNVPGVEQIMAKDLVNYQPLIFGSKNDVMLAINALSEQGINSGEDVKSCDRSDLVRICCEALMW